MKRGLNIFCLIVFLCVAHYGYDTFSVFKKKKKEVMVQKVEVQQVGEGSLESEVLAFPSPAKEGRTQIGFRVGGGSIELRFELYDPYGQKRYEHEQNYEIGYHRITINEEVLGYTLPVNVYYYLMIDVKTNKIIARGKFGVVR